MGLPEAMVHFRGFRVVLRSRVWGLGGLSAFDMRDTRAPSKLTSKGIWREGLIFYLIFGDVVYHFVYDGAFFGASTTSRPF